MDTVQISAIQRWIKDVSTSQDGLLPDERESDSKKPTDSGRLPTPPSTSPPQLRAKRKYNSEDDSMPQPDPQKRLRRMITDESDTGSAVSVPLSDNITLSPSITTRSDSAISRPRQRSSSPTRAKTSLARATPRVIYIHELSDPGCEEAKRLLEFLSESETACPLDAEEVSKVSTASWKCSAEVCSEGSWVMEVARPLLQLAIGGLPLECWSVQTESVDPKYQPRYTERDAYNRKIDLVVGLPTDKWGVEYERLSTNFADQYLSHIAHPHTGMRLLGLGIEVKAADGNLIEAEVQLGVWMAGLVSWVFEHRREKATPPPMVGCIALGDRWDFYIVYGMETDSSELVEVRVWGPFSDLYGRTTKEKTTSALAKTLRRAMEYTQGCYARQLLNVIVG